jgi:hypothetical protein
LGDRSAVRAAQQALALEQAQVAADRGGRDVERGGDFADVNASVRRQPLEDRAQTLRLLHARSVGLRAGVMSTHCVFSVAYCSSDAYIGHK